MNEESLINVFSTLKTISTCSGQYSWSRYQFVFLHWVVGPGLTCDGCTNRNRQWQDISYERHVFRGTSNRAGCREIFWFMGWIIIWNLYTVIFIFENNELFINTIVIPILAIEGGVINGDFWTVLTSDKKKVWGLSKRRWWKNKIALENDWHHLTFTIFPHRLGLSFTHNKLILPRRIQIDKTSLLYLFHLAFVRFIFTHYILILEIINLMRGRKWNKKVRLY